MKLFALAAVSIASLMAASSAAWAQTELRIAHQAGTESAKVMDEVVADFEKLHPDISIKQLVFSSADYENTGLVTQLQSSTPPDIYFQWAGYPVERDVKTGTAFDLTGAMATDGWKETFQPGLWTAGSGTTVDGHIYLVPTSVGVDVTLWYNTKLFKKLNLDTPKTWADLMTDVKAIAASGVTPIVIGNKEQWPLGNWISQIASRLVPPADYEAAFNQDGPFKIPGFQHAFQLLKDLHDAGAFNIDMATLDQDQGMATFFQSAAAIDPIGWWLVRPKDQISDPDFDYAQFNTPIIDDTTSNKDNVSGSGEGFIVNAHSEHKDAAIAFLKFMTSAENQAKWIAATGQSSPVIAANVGANLDPHVAEIATLMNTASSLTAPPDTSYPLPVARTFYQAAAYVASGDKSPDDALDWLDATLKSMGKQTN